MSDIQIKEMVSGLVDWYAVTENGLLTMDYSKIPEHELNSVAALMVSQDDMLMGEATGPDNPEWDKAMRSALVRTMLSPTESSEEFRDVWVSAIRSYVMPMIRRMVDEKLEWLNEDRECHTSLIFNRATGVTMEVSRAG